jgi:acyl-CoA reductase-like NAD-dependent aldehyde dehydrogenase
MNVVMGEVAEIGEPLVTDERVDMVSFTGSTASGKRVMELASRSLKRISLELGGKSPNIVFEDADLAAAASAAAWGIFWRSGQVCTAGSRLFVQESVHDEVVERLVTTAKAMRVGSPERDDVDLGPVISPAHLERVERYVASGLAEGARLLHGGARLAGGEYERGAYIGPTVFTDVAPSMTIAQEEVFGPLLAVMRFGDVEEAVALANDTVFGLASGVWTRDIGKALRVARGLKAGTVWVNGWGIVNPEVPVGGWKASGFGRELGRSGLEEFLLSKSVHVAG